MTYGIALVKVLPSQYLLDFLAGNLYLNTTTYFGKIDSRDALRYDAHDGADGAIQAKEVAIGMNGESIPIETIGPIIFRRREVDERNILCFYTITNRPEDGFDPKIMSFGDTAVLIAKLPEFIGKVKVAAQALNRNLKFAPVEYVDRQEHDGPMGSFRKFSELSYQNEFRFVLAGGNGQPFRLQIGSIDDLVIVLPSSDIPNLWSNMREE